MSKTKSGCNEKIAASAEPPRNDGERDVSDAMNSTETFNQHRPLLFSIAYRMIGSVQDAEDIVQETFIRWTNSSADVQSPKSYLASVTTRLAIDHLKSARVKRESYYGPWLPEPYLGGEPESERNLALAESLSTAFLVLLDTLSPTERAAFLLREVYDYPYAEIAQWIGKSEPACRQLVKRARDRIHAGAAAPRTPQLEQERMVERFIHVASEGDIEDFLALLSEDAVLHADGGGKVPSAKLPIYGAEKIARFFVGVRRFQSKNLTPTITTINGQTGVLLYADGALHSAWTFLFQNGRIQALYGVRNPDKLKAAASK